MATITYKSSSIYTLDNTSSSGNKGEVQVIVGVPELKSEVIPSRPADSRISLERSPTSLDIKIPPWPLPSCDNTLLLCSLLGLYGMALWYTVYISPMLLSIFGLYFMPSLLFSWSFVLWASRGMLDGSFQHERLAVGPHTWRHVQRKSLFGIGSSHARFLAGANSQPSFLQRCAHYLAKAKFSGGDVESLLGARLLIESVLRDTGELITVVELLDHNRKVHLGASKAEQQWLVHEINSFLGDMRGRPVDVSTFPPPDPPSVIENRRNS